VTYCINVANFVQQLPASVLPTDLWMCDISDVSEVWDDSDRDRDWPCFMWSYRPIHCYNL